VQRNDLRRWIGETSISEVSRASGLSEESLLRWLSELPVRNGTRILLEQMTAPPMGKGQSGPESEAP